MLKTALQKIGWHLQSRPEPTIKDMLSDSIVQAVMEADGINPQVLKVELMSIARQISARCTRARRLSGAVSIAAWRLGTTRRDNLPEGNTWMLAILAENLKLILLLFMIATIVGLSWFGNERLMTASRSIHQRRIEMRERKVRFSKSSVRKKKAPKLTRIDAS